MFPSEPHKVTLGLSLLFVVISAAEKYAYFMFEKTQENLKAPSAGNESIG